MITIKTEKEIQLMHEAGKILAACHREIGNHTWDHPKMTNLTDKQIIDEITKTNDILFSLAGYKPSIFRPPYGLADQRVIQDVAHMNMKVIDWSVDTRDWAGTPVASIMDFVKKEVTPGGIILEHCAGGRGENLSNTVTALPEIIDYLKKTRISILYHSRIASYSGYHRRKIKIGLSSKKKEALFSSLH